MRTEKDGLHTLREMQRIRDAVPLPSTVSELYDGDKLRSQYIEHTPARKALQRYHKRTGEAVYRDDLPIGLKQALKLPLVWNQITHRYPWKVMWVRTDSQGRRKKGQKLCTTLGGAIKEWDRIRAIVPNATVVSRSRGYDIPPKLRGKLPPRWYWCPRCMKPRRYARDPDGARFYVLKKVWRPTKGRYEWVERQVYLLRCPMCSTTNKDQVFRRSNQPWEVRKFKRGVRTARRRKKVVRRRKSAHST